MYSTNLKDNRYKLNCIAIAKEIRVIKFIVDTGARNTCCNYRVIDKCMQECELRNSETKLIGGLIKGEAVRFYRYRLKQITIGTINMDAQFIWITFDKRVTDIVLGMDLLKKDIMITNPYNKKVYFCKDAEDFNQNFCLKIR